VRTQTNPSVRWAVGPGLAVLALSLPLALSACAAGNEASGAESTLSGTLNGGGSSAQESAQGAWRAGFQGRNSDVTVNYDPVGSGTGRENFLSGAYLFAGSDSALADDELADAAKRCGDEPPLEVPAYVSPIAVVFHVEGIDRLRLSAPTIAKIFAGTITTWDDPRIAAENPDASLPGTTITPVHRSDDSGTTANFTDYLAQAGGGAWGHEPDGVWPLKGGEAAEGTSGLIAAVGAGDGTIGYADESQAGSLGVASLEVGSEFNAPTPEGAAQVLAASPRTEGRADVDLATDVDRTTTEPGAYPLMLTSYLIACQHYDSAAEAGLVRGYLSYVVSADGQRAAAEQAGSAPLADVLQKKAAAIVAKIAAR
jgi:phosphate transport system substrate-binding protein